MNPLAAMRIRATVSRSIFDTLRVERFDREKNPPPPFPSHISPRLCLSAFRRRIVHEFLLRFARGKDARESGGREKSENGRITDNVAIEIHSTQLKGKTSVPRGKFEGA